MKRIWSLFFVMVITISSLWGCRKEDEGVYRERSNNAMCATEDANIAEMADLYDSCRVLVNNTDLSTSYYAFYDAKHSCMILPVVAVLKELGATVDWETESLAKISVNSRVYILDTKNNSITSEKDKKDNLIPLPPGTPYGWYVPTSGDFLINDNTLRYLLARVLGVDVRDVRFVYDTRAEQPTVDIQIPKIENAASSFYVVSDGNMP